MSPFGPLSQVMCGNVGLPKFRLLRHRNVGHEAVDAGAFVAAHDIEPDVMQPEPVTDLVSRRPAQIEGCLRCSGGAEGDGVDDDTVRGWRPAGELSIPQ